MGNSFTQKHPGAANEQLQHAMGHFLKEIGIPAIGPGMAAHAGKLFTDARATLHKG